MFLLLTTRLQQPRGQACLCRERLFLKFICETGKETGRETEGYFIIPLGQFVKKKKKISTLQALST